MLSQEQIETFDNQGFLVVEGFKSEASCRSLLSAGKKWVNELVDEQGKAIFSTRDQHAHSNAYFLDSGSEVRVFMEEERDGEIPRVNKLGHAMHDLDETYEEFCRDSRMSEIAQEIGMKSPLLVQSMHIFKHPRVGGEVKVHQDSSFLYTNPTSVNGFWFALDDATRENGCLWALPGGHKEALRTRFVRSGTDATETIVLDDRPLPEEGFVPVEVDSGALVLLHGQLPHYSEANRSQKSREAFALHVVDGSCDYPEENWLQRKASLPFRGFLRE